MKVLILAAVPIGLLAMAITVTLLTSWSSGEGLCETWMGPMLPYCAAPEPKQVRT